MINTGASQIEYMRLTWLTHLVDMQIQMVIDTEEYTAVSCNRNCLLNIINQQH